jgi:2-C-methyl-D-erythritol 4-phosphate cytidylyltransferase
MNVAIIPAAGQGRRMGGGRAKQFLELDGEPVLVHTLRRFDACPSIDSVVVALPEGEAAAFLQTAARAGIRKVARVVAGGAERQESVARALACVRPETARVVVVHDGVRPFVTPVQIAEVTNRAATAGAAILAVRASDTVKEVDELGVVRTLDRARIALAQTPQAFRYEWLRDAYERARREGWEVTDDASLVERAGYRVEIVEGSPFNLKITRPDDLALARFILGQEFGGARRRDRGPGARDQRRRSDP